MTADPSSAIKVENQVMCLSHSVLNFGWKTTQSLFDSTRKKYVSISSYMT